MKKKQDASVDIELNKTHTVTTPLVKERWYTSDSLEISFDPNRFSLLVTEQPPLPHRIAFCGGGSRIPAHIGALEELHKRGLYLTEFSGSSAGALIATVAYLGYSCVEINEIISWFDEDKLLDNPFNVNLTTLKQLIFKGGLSSPKSLQQAANYVILNKVMNIISDERYRHRFVNHQAFLKEQVFNSPSSITFATLAKIKQICPECEIGDKLIITGTNLHSKECEIFSAGTTPKMRIADAIAISANLPVAFERIKYQGKSYSDGGITINFPIYCFPRTNDHSFFLKHRSDVDYSVIGLQFDNGFEDSALYSQKPLHKWSWLSSKFFAYITGHDNATDNWQNDLRELRRHAQQSILIKTPAIPFGKLTLSDEVHEKCIESGRKAARNYLDHHGYYVDSSGQTQRNEWMYKTFKNPEELLNYCLEIKQSNILEALYPAIKKCRYLEKGYKQYLLALCDRLLTEAKICQVDDHQSIQDEAFKTNNNSSESSCSMTLFASSGKAKSLLKVSQSVLKIRLFTRLYPIMMQNWHSLCPVSGIGDIFNTIRQSTLSVDSAHRCMQLLISKLQQINVGHFLVFIFKSALKHYQVSKFDHVLDNLKYLYQSIGLIIKHQIHTDEKYYGNWDFDEHDAKKIFQVLNSRDLSSLNEILDGKRNQQQVFYD